MFSRLFKRVSRAGAFVLGMVLILALGVLAAFIWTTLVSTDIGVIAPDVSVISQFTDDDAFADQGAYDPGDDGLTDPMGPGPYAPRYPIQIGTCTIDYVSGAEFDLTIVDGYADYYCTAFIRLMNNGTEKMRINSPSHDFGPDVEVDLVTPEGVDLVPGGQAIVGIIIHVLPTMAAGNYSGLISVVVEATP